MPDPRRRLRHRHVIPPPPPPSTTATTSSATTSDPLANLAAIRSQMDTLHSFLSDSVNSNTLLPKHQLQSINTHLSSSIKLLIVNASALLSSSTYHPPIIQDHHPGPTTAAATEDHHHQVAAEEENDCDDGEEGDDDAYDVVELDAVELLAEHLHFCEVCGKGFKRDANLRMHMRAHGEQFKSPAALAKPTAEVVTTTTTTTLDHRGDGRRKTRFSCPYVGCDRNKGHRKFRPLKSVICVKNHFKRSHCPKMYSCDRCNKKSFSVLADLRSHLRHCGEAKWRCSCGTSFSRKDKLFGHMALFEGHMPAIGGGCGGGGGRDDDDGDNSSVGKSVSSVVDVVMEEPEEDRDPPRAGKGAVDVEEEEDVVFDDALLERLGSIEDNFLQELLGNSCDDSSTGIDGFFNF